MHIPRPHPESLPWQAWVGPWSLYFLGECCKWSWDHTMGPWLQSSEDWVPQPPSEEGRGGSTEAGRRRHTAKGWGLAQTVRMSRSPQIYKKEGASWPSESPLCYPGFQAEHRAGLSTSSDSGFEINERITAGDITCQAAPSLPHRGHRVP